MLSHEERIDFSALTAPFGQPVRQAVSRVDHKSIVVFLHLKGISANAKDVHTELVQILESDAIAELSDICMDQERSHFAK
jgi:hypothetical protein